MADACPHAQDIALNRAAAKAAGLHYVTEEESGPVASAARTDVCLPGCEGPRGARCANPRADSILVIPPAWTDVWICARADGHLQATGRDARGRKQHRYHPNWTSTRHRAKYDRMVEFALALPEIRRRVQADLRKPAQSREHVLATVVTLLEKTLIRIGNKEYARANNSFGLTTLMDEHVQIKGSSMTFRFRAKSGIMQTIELEDAPLARIVKNCRDLPGKALFQYLDKRRHVVSASTRPQSTRTFATSRGSRSRPRTSGRGPQACWRRLPSASFLSRPPTQRSRGTS